MRIVLMVLGLSSLLLALPPEWSKAKIIKGSSCIGGVDDIKIVGIIKGRSYTVNYGQMSGDLNLRWPKHKYEIRYTYDAVLKSLIGAYRGKKSYSRMITKKEIKNKKIILQCPKNNHRVPVYNRGGEIIKY
ncbi:MAG: hypothetical protein P8Y46_05380 [Sulfurovaceae bacterium]